MGSCILLVLLLLSACGAAYAANTYDYMQFVQQWPSAFCYGNPDCDVPNTPLGTFTIHGLWPSNYSAPEVECVGRPFNPAEMSAAENRDLTENLLPQAWPQLNAHYTNSDFWKYEYNKHGTCSENNLKQMKYFRQAYQAWVRFNAYYLFIASSMQIYPTGHSYYKTDLEAAIQQGTGQKPLLICKKVPVINGSVWLLQEIIICLDPRAVQVVRCGSRRSNNCTNPLIYYGY